MIFKTYISDNEVLKFSITSGDKNPIHTDKKFARRQFVGTKIAHGTLLIEKFFNFFFKNKKYFIEEFSCNFLGTCEVNSKLNYNYKVKHNKVYCNIIRERKTICYFKFIFSKNISKL